MNIKNEIYDAVIIVTCGAALECFLQLAFVAAKPNSTVKVIVRSNSCNIEL